MNYTKINAHIVDQTIQLTNIPLLASGGVNEIRVNFTFCSLWDGTARVAVFYRDPAKVYHVPIVDSVVTVPQEVTAEKGAFFMGVFGIVGDTTRTTHNVQLDLEQGAYTTGENVPEPTPDVYQQILSAYAECGPKAEEALDLAQRAFDRCKPKAGFIYPLATEVVPEGFLLCDGAEYGREEYPELFAAIGTIYGPGDGETTFNVPDLRKRTLIGAGDGYPIGWTGGETEHTLTAAELPSHTHEQRLPIQGYAGWENKLDIRGAHALLSYNGIADSSVKEIIYNPNPTEYDDVSLIYGGRTSEEGGGMPHSNMQPSAASNYIIATGKDTAVSVSDIIRGAQAIPLEVQYGGTGATGSAQARENLDVYSKKYVDDLAKPVLLWQNADIYSELRNQTIPLGDVSEYSEYIVQMVNHAQYRSKIGRFIHTGWNNVYDTGATFYGRGVCLHSNGDLQINGCHYWNKNDPNPILNFSELIIEAVYGVKGVDK